MKNERGLTLVELLAVLVIFSVIMMLLGTVLVNGMKSSNRTVTNQQLQQEANYIMEKVRSEYLIPQKDVPDGDFKLAIKLKIDEINQQLLMNDVVISEGYIYNLEPSDDSPKNLLEMISRTGSPSFNLTIKKDGKDKPFSIVTTLSKLP